MSAQQSLPLPSPLTSVLKDLNWTRWVNNEEPKHISVPAHGSSVITCLIFSHGRIISASDDHSIHVYSPETGELIRPLKGHNGGVWALAATKDMLASGSTDGTVRIWDLNTGESTHVFGGHTSTVRCLDIVVPELVEVEGPDGVVEKEKWPKRPLIVTGSRDHSLGVWTLPKLDDPEYRSRSVYAKVEDSDGDLVDVADNPYHRLLLKGHHHAVRALAARGRTLASGSYDCSVRIWDVIDGTLYSVVLDLPRNQVYSGSMDGTARMWNLSTGDCTHTLTGHTSLVGLLGLSSSYLVSASADSTLRIWNPETGELQHTLTHTTGAITCFQHDDFKVLGGSDGCLKMWNIQDGTEVRDLLTGITSVWQVAFEGRWCVAANSRKDTTWIDIWDFGNEDGAGESVAGTSDQDVLAGDGDDDEEANARIRRFLTDK
ncbi:cell division control protein 4 [Coprinopsis sp. MPI-PUGE-AT-0042]|nr:cell division control protein 4 [Coprinopsis sp. MPI-PUGE-AT-0042]